MVQIADVAQIQSLTPEHPYAVGMAEKEKRKKKKKKRSSRRGTAERIRLETMRFRV